MIVSRTTSSRLRATPGDVTELKTTVHGSSRETPNPLTSGHDVVRHLWTRYLSMLIDLVLKGTIDPGKVFDRTLALDQVTEGYRAMDERRVIKTLLQP